MDPSSCCYVVNLIRMTAYKYRLNPLNANLNPICHLLALLAAHHILHISRIRVNVSGRIPFEPAVFPYSMILTACTHAHRSLECEITLH
jgi:hypothetical protein